MQLWSNFHHMNMAEMTGNRTRTGHVTFWILFVISTLVLFVGVLFATTPSTNHTTDAAIFALATFLVCISLLVGVAQKQLRLAPLARVACVTLAAELLICIWLLIDALRHLHKL
jgi:uncharacterized membrane protein